MVEKYFVRAFLYLDDHVWMFLLGTEDSYMDL